MSSRCMMSCLSRLVISGGLALLGAVALAGCSSGGELPKEDIDTYAGELRLATPRYLGEIEDGESRTNYYSNPPRYRAFGFNAKGGDTITATVKSLEGDAMGWITSSKFDVLAANDDYGEDLDSKVVYEVPAGTPSRSYRIVFRDYSLVDATFTVSLSLSKAVTSCSYGGKTYRQGDSFPDTAGCNTCSCAAGGRVACTERACVCNPEAEPWRNYVGTPATCATIRYMCPSGKRAFQNACGCGCELFPR